METWARKGHLTNKKDDVGRNSRGRKYPEVGHPPRNRVKTDWESEGIQSMYERAGYNTKKGVIHVKVGKGPLSRRNDQKRM